MLHVVPQNTTETEPVASSEPLYRLNWVHIYPQGVERVWIAISNEDEVSAWMKFAARLDLHPGGTIHIDFSDEESMEGMVCQLEAPKLLTYTWGDSLVKWVLEDVPTGTRLHLSHIGVRPDLLTGMGAGWHAFLDQLGDHLLGTEHPSHYRELKTLYDKEMRPEPVDRQPDL